MNPKSLILKYIFTLAFILILPAFAFSQRPVGYKGIHQEHLEEFGKAVPEVVDLLTTAEVLPLQKRAITPDRYVVGYHPYWNNGLQSRYKWELLTAINYFNVEVGSNGSIVKNNGWPYNTFINAAHTHGVGVQLVVTNFSSESLATLLGSAGNRSRAINNIVNLMINGNGDGIDIDFEGVPSSRKTQLVTFMRELREALNTRGSNYTLSMASPAVDWSSAWDYDALADICDWLFLMGYNYFYSGSPSAGPVAPLKLNSGWYLTRSVNDYLFKTKGDTSKIILGLPYYGIKWPVISNNGYAKTRGRGSSIFYKRAKSEVAGFGRKWEDTAKSPWYSYNSNGWFVAWYDDEVSLSHKYTMATDKGLLGVGMWALGYDDGFNELWQTLFNHFGATGAPKPPTRLRVETDVTRGDIVVSFLPDSGATSFDFYMSTDGENFRFAGNSISPGLTLTRVSVDSIYYFKAVGRNRFGTSSETEVLASLPGLLQQVLIVNGFDTDTGVVPVNTHDYVIQYGESIKATGYTFNSTSNEAVESGEVALTDYEIVIWILGNESVATYTLTSLEQARIKDFLKTGGKLFISGSNIGFDMVENGTSASNTFFSEYLKTTYVKDNAVENSPAYTANPNTIATLFSGLGNINFDDGTQGTYQVQRPDGILPAPLSGSRLVLTYDSVDPDLNGGAGIAYAGTFEAGTLNGALVYFSFPFETITDAAMRDSIMARIFKFFSTPPTGIEHVETPEIPNAYSLAQNYPNPFNPGTTIEFKLVKSSRVKLIVYNVLGQNVVTLVDKDMTAGNYKVEWNGQDDSGQKVASGVYIYELKSEHFTARKKMIYLR